jgi:peptide/nickel transport system permease protein
MTTYIGQRFLHMIPVLLLITVVSFALIFVLPGDPALLLLGDQAMIDQKMYDSIRRELGLDRPIPVQYLDWLGKVVRGDLGLSTRDRQPILEGMLMRLPVTLELAALAMIIAILIGIPAGIISAMRPNSVWDMAGSVFSLAGVAMPSFWLAILLIYGVAVILHLLPPSGYERFSADPVQNLQLMVLPSLTLGMGLSGVLMRQVRSGLLEILHQEYITTARAKGLPERRVVLRHALRNALIPIVTVVGLQVGRLLGGTVIIEQMFAIPGIGRWAVDSIFMRDFAVVQAVSLVMAVGVLLANLIADVVYGWIDPRISYS